MNFRIANVSVFLLLLLVVIMFTVTYLSMTPDLVGDSIVYMFFGCLLILVARISLGGKVAIPRHPFFVLVILMLASPLVSLLIVSNNLNGIKEIAIVLRYIVPIFLLVSLSLLMYENTKTALPIVASVSAIFFLFYIFMMLIESSYIRDEMGYLRQSNWGNVVIAASPLVALIRSKSIRYLLLMLLVFSVFYSLKRSGALFLVLALFVYLGFILLYKKSITPSQIIKIVGFLTVSPLLILFTLDIVAENQFVDMLATRLDSVVDDGGSGRIGIWSSLLEVFLESNLVNIIFGNLSESNRTLMNIGIHSAHNDYLGSLVNFGVLGFVLFLAFIWMTFRVSVRFVLCTGEHNVFPVSLFIGAVFTFSLTSGIFVYSTMFFPFFLMLSLMLNTNVESNDSVKV